MHGELFLKMLQEEIGRLLLWPARHRNLLRADQHRIFPDVLGRQVSGSQAPTTLEGGVMRASRFGKCYTCDTLVLAAGQGVGRSVKGTMSVLRREG